MAKGVLLAYTSAVAGREAEFDAWYELHASEVVAAVPQMKEFARYTLVDPEHADAAPRYLCVYDIEADDVMEAAAALGAAAPGLTMSDTLDLAENPPVMQWFQGR